MKTVKVKRKIITLAVAAITLISEMAAPQSTFAADPVQLTGGATVREAPQIELSQDYDAELVYGKDTIYYTFTTSSRTDSTYKAHLEYLGGTEKENVDLSILSEDGDKVIGVFLKPTSTSVASGNTSILKAKTRYIIKIETWNGYADSDSDLHLELEENHTEDISFRITENIAAPQQLAITRTKAVGKKAIKVSWSRSSSAVKYQLCYREEGASKWKKKTTTKNSIKVTGLKKEKTYEFKVRGIRVEDGKSYSGTWSQTSRAKTK